jgi:hypothetical protein
MPASAKFATGKYALGICDVCGVRYMLSELRATTIRGRRTGILSCPICWDADHPQNFLPEALTVDAEALRISRPEDYGPSRILWHWRPADSVALQTALGDVEVVTV